MSHYSDDDTVDIPKEHLQEHELSHDSVHTEEHEEHEHVDERWLVSYADMMTLLFGLFVLLYSMSNLDKKAAQQIMESTKEKFGSPTTETVPKAIDPISLQEKIKELEEQNTILKEKEQSQAPLLEEASKKLAQLNVEFEKAKIQSQEERNHLEHKIELLEQDAKKIQEMAKVDLKDKSSEDSKQKVLKEKIQNLIDKLRDSQEKEKLVEQKLVEQKKSISELSKQVLSTRNVASIQSSLEEAQTQNKELTEQIKSLKDQVNEAKGANASQAFLAVFINWSTKDHDIDLTIKDPNNQIFDFKHRKNNSSPGLFALDTRRGPGAELWQSDRIIPGRYTATYSFYNQYGNKENAKVSGTIYSPKGSFVINPIEMSIDKNKTNQIFFDVTAEGEVKILNTR